jgi:hypothetical protein
MREVIRNLKVFHFRNWEINHQNEIHDCPVLTSSNTETLQRHGGVKYPV